MNQPLKTNNSLRRRFVIAAFWLSSTAAAFTYGIGVGRYSWPPLELVYRHYCSFHNRYIKEQHPSGEDELLHFAFTDPLIAMELIHPPISAIEDIREANRRIFMPADDFENACRNLNILSARTLTLDDGATSIVRVRFSYRGSEHRAYAYGKLPSAPMTNRPAMLIIPGSGLNQSSAIHFRDVENYHYGIMDAADEVGADAFTFVKPNEDFLAWHDGERKINKNFIVAYHLNRGGSFSVSYIVRSMAIVKHLQSLYDHCIVAGLSQGGAAALLNALQTRPTAAVIASGYSVLGRSVEWAGYNQILGIPMLGRLTNPTNLVTAISATPTEFLFTWGSEETGTYRMEADNGYTAEYIEPLEHVECVIHENGHVFPVPEIEDFLSRTLTD